MKSIKSGILIIFAGFILTLRIYPAHAEFDLRDKGGRAMGMGGAYGAVCDDVSSVYYNPAGLGRMRAGEISTGYGRLFMGLTDHSRIQNGMIAVGYIFERIGTFALSWSVLDLNTWYSENTYILSYGIAVHKKAYIGVNAKMYEKKYNTALSVFQDPQFSLYKAAQKYTADIGVVINAAEKLYCGISLYDITQPDLSFEKGTPLPASCRIGAAYRDYIAMTSVNCDVLLKERYWQVMGGGEIWNDDGTYGARSGISVGTLDGASFSVGFSAKITLMRIDYVFRYPLTGINALYGSHHMFLSTRFGRSRKNKDYEELQEANKKTVRDSYMRGIRYFKRGNFEKAVQEWENVLRINPRHRRVQELMRQAERMMRK